MFTDYNNVVNPEWDYEKSARVEWRDNRDEKSSTDIYWAKFFFQVVKHISTIFGKKNNAILK